MQYPAEPITPGLCPAGASLSGSPSGYPSGSPSGPAGGPNRPAACPARREGEAAWSGTKEIAPERVAGTHPGKERGRDRSPIGAQGIAPSGRAGPSAGTGAQGIARDGRAGYCPGRARKTVARDGRAEYRPGRARRASPRARRTSPGDGSCRGVAAPGGAEQPRSGPLRRMTLSPRPGAALCPPETATLPRSGGMAPRLRSLQ